MKRFFLLPNIITAFGLSCGLFVIYKVILAGEETPLFALLQSSTLFILLAAFADFFDGAVARMIKAESDFGGEFDSLSDVITFGVAPPLLILKSLSLSQTSRLENLFLIIAAMIYTLCGVLRLVRYNLHRKVVVRERLLIKKQRRYFIGLPIPGAAAVVLSLCLILYSPFMESFALKDSYKMGALLATLIAIGFFMVSRWKFPSLSALYFRVPTFNLVMILGVGVVVLLYGIQEHFALIFFTVSWSYLLLSFFVIFYRFVSGKSISLE